MAYWFDEAISSHLFATFCGGITKFRAFDSRTNPLDRRPELEKDLSLNQVAVELRWGWEGLGWEAATMSGNEPKNLEISIY